MQEQATDTPLFCFFILEENERAKQTYLRVKYGLVPVLGHRFRHFVVHPDVRVTPSFSFFGDFFFFNISYVPDAEVEIPRKTKLVLFIVSFTEISKRARAVGKCA